MSSSLAPSLLISMPQLTDPNFAKSVVLLCEHSSDGAFGLIVNRPMVTTGRVVVNLEPPVITAKELQLWIGGPVEPQRSWILLGSHAAEGDAGHTKVAEGLYLSTSPDILRKLLAPNPPPRSRLVVGSSGWGPGQLEEELEQSAWLLSDVDCDFLFTTPSDRMWDAAIRRLGADPNALTMSHGVH
jgi:putative transcriptional regulator